MSATPNLALPYILAAQAQKHVVHNEAIRALDALVQLGVLSRVLSAPPATPSDGDRYIVASGASGAWSAHENHVAAWQDGAWAFHVPRTGWTAWIADEEILAVWNGTQWQAASSGGSASVNPAALVGVNTTADANNRLAVKADAVLMTHDDVTPGTGSMRQSLNKAAPANTVSQLYQTGFSGRAETGLTGDDDFHIKVSPDGTAWHEALVVDRATGIVDFRAGAPTLNGATLATGAGQSGIGAYVRNRTGVNFHHWHRALRRQMQLGERPRINMYGDSITLGSGGLVQKFSPAQLLADELTRRGFTARANVFGTSFRTTAQYTGYEPRMVFTGTWVGWSQVQGKSGLRATSAGASVTYTPGYAFDRADVHYIQQTAGLGGGGAFTLTIDGGATQFSTPTSGGLVTSQTISVAAAGGFTVVKLDVTINGAAAAHTITLTNGATGVFELYGLEPWNAQAPEIMIRSAAGSGLTSSSLATGTAATSIWRLPCDLYMLNIGRNDSAADVPLATYGANLDTIEANMRVFATSILYWTPPPAAASVKALSQQQTYADEMIARAGSDIVVFDQFKRWLDRGGQAALAENSGGDWYDDTIHPSQWGNRDMARALADVVLWAE